MHASKTARPACGRPCRCPPRTGAGAGGEGVGDCREAAGREEALDAAAREAPDVALVDLSPGSDDALALIAELCARNIPVLVCSMHEEPAYVRRALAAGARGYITKREAPRDLARALRDVQEGWMLISPRAAEGLRGM